MVLSLPLLLMVMALMIDFGASASWKTRAAMVARDAAWTARWPRSGILAPPANWPMAQASQSVAAGNAVSALADPSIDQPVVRGPMIGQTTVNRPLLDPTQGLIVGKSTLTRSMPMLAKGLAPMQYNLQSPLLENTWPYQRMGLSSNLQLREPVIYTFAQADPSFMQAYISSVLAIWYSPLQTALAVLDKDAEIYAFYGAYHDFHPRLRHFCSLDVQSVLQNEVQPLINHIQGSQGPPKIHGVPERMAHFFIAMYQAELQRLMSGAPVGGETAADLQAKIQSLQGFVGGL